ncbi:MAG: peptide ABC transporter permease, partial [Pseudomonadota bacterium]
MTDTLDLTGRKEAVETAIQGGRSLWDDAKARLFRNKAAVVSMWVLGFMVFVAAIGPFLWVHDYRTISANVELAP